MASRTFLSGSLFVSPKRIWTQRCLFSAGSFKSADRKSSRFASTPAPPRLPREEQEVFEELQRQSTGAFSTPQAPPKVNPSPDVEKLSFEVEAATSAPPLSSRDAGFAPPFGQDGKELHPDLRLGAKPEFEGEKNPETGEIGGPKREPLRWGSEGDWSYNGRVTDFWSSYFFPPGLGWGM
jgi:hypothetical protein